MKSPSSPRSPRAFTLVEMLVVAAVVSILAALLFTVFNSVRENGRRTVCLSNQKQILLALQTYASDNAGNFPYQVDPTTSSWINCMSSYISSPQLLVCPNDGDIAEKTRVGYYIAPNGTKNPSIPSSYIVTEELLNTRPYKIDKAHHIVGGVRSLSSIVQPATTVLLCDGAHQALPKAPYWTTEISGQCAVSVQEQGYILRDPFDAHANPVTPPTLYNECYAPNTRHLGRVVVSFVDGHVKAMETSNWYFPNTPFLDPARGG